MSKPNTGHARGAGRRVIAIALFGLLLFGPAPLALRPDRAISNGAPPSRTSNPITPGEVRRHVVSRPSPSAGSTCLHGAATPAATLAAPSTSGARLLGRIADMLTFHPFARD